MFTDTDSLCYESNCDFYKKFYNLKELFDLSNHLNSTIYFCDENRKVLRKMKDEYGGNIIIEFIGVRSKMYSILDTNNNEKAQAKVTMLL